MPLCVGGTVGREYQENGMYESTVVNVYKYRCYSRFKRWYKWPLCVGGTTELYVDSFETSSGLSTSDHFVWEVQENDSSGLSSF